MKIRKIASLFLMSFLLPSCASTNGPRVLSVDLSDSVCTFMCNNCTGYSEENKSDINADGTKMIFFHLYKTNADGVTTRVKFKTNKSDDDSYFKDEDFIFTDLTNISDKYFYGNFRGDRYFIDKQTGETLLFNQNYVLFDEHFSDYTSARHTYQEDKNGNIYTCAYCTDSHSYQIIKLAKEENKIKANVVYDYGNNNDLYTVYIFSRDNFSYAVDNEGNVACFAFNSANSYYFITSDGTVINQQSKEICGNGNMYFWTGYDGNIYLIEEGNVKKIVYNNIDKAISTENIVSYSELSNKDLSLDNFIFLDEAKKIFYYKENGKESIELYQLYGENISSEKIVISDDSLFPKSEFEKSAAMMSIGEINADGNNIYVTSKGALIKNDERIECWVVAKINVDNNISITRNHFSAYVIDAIRILRNGKMCIFYWNDCPINIRDKGIFMSVGIFDTNTGELTSQDSFITGNANRSHIICL